MATVVIMPRQGQSVESCIITAWEKKKGEPVKAGDTLFSYETDKSAFEEKAMAEGVLLEVFAKEGDEVPCLDPVCVIGEPGEDISALVPQKDLTAAESDADQNARQTAAEQSPAPAALEAEPARRREDMKISPRAKMIAGKTGADLTGPLSATGPGGRVIERDINALLDKGFTARETPLPDQSAAAVTGAPAQAEYEDLPLTNIRKVIAKAMRESLLEMAQLTLDSSFDASEILSCRAAFKERGEQLGVGNITLNDMVLFAVSRALKNHKDLNAHYLGDKMRYFNGVHLGIAVDTERGLMVPTLFDAHRMSLSELSKQAKTLIKEAQGGTIAPDKLKGASFTVTNLGSLGVESFTPVINPPQTAILGVNNITRRLKESGGKDMSYPAMGLSLTFDHRAVDGAPAARFLQELCLLLEQFRLLLAK